jgi:hypothetical protein
MWVTNNSEHDLEDGYDGKRYLFAKGQSVEVPPVVCNHVFGYGADNKVAYLQRLGWMKHSGELEKALDRLNKFSFSSERPKQNVHVLSPVVDANPVPAPKQRKAGLVQIAA